MERAFELLKDIKVTLSESVIEGMNLDIDKQRKLYHSAKEIEGLLSGGENEEEMLDIPKLPSGLKYNPYPRMVYAIICEKYSHDKFFTVADIMQLTGASRNQIKADIVRLEKEGHIVLVDSFYEQRTRFYKYKPTK